MKTTDLRDFFDDCYSGYEDFTTEMTLYRDKQTQRWVGDGVSFSRDETLGWKYNADDGSYNYGYDTLKEAVSKYIGAMAADRTGEKRFCASRFLDVDYKMDNLEGKISCRVTVRHFLPEYNEQRFQDKCETLTQAFDMLMS